MQADESKDSTAVAREAAYRRGWQQGFTEAAIIIAHLIEQGSHRREINHLLAIYNDHVLSPWRAEDLESRETVPAFDIKQLLAIAQRGGYDWMLKE